MAEGTSKTIDQLPEKQTLLNADMMAVDDGAQTYRVLWSTILKAAGGIKTVTETTDKTTIVLQDGKTIEITKHDSGKQDKLTFDNAPTKNSTNPVTSGGIFTKFETVEKALTDEAQTARDAEKANADNIASALEALTAAQTAISANATAISAEAQTARQAESALNSAISSEAQAARQAEGALNTAIGNVSGNLNTLAQLFNSLGLYVDDEGYICQKI